MSFRALFLTILLAVLISPMLIGAAGCTSSTPLSDRPQWARQLAELPYPADAENGADLDMTVKKQGESLVIVSREPRSFENVQIWMNRQYVTVVDRIATADRIEAPLDFFVNKHGESFPTGWLLAPEKARPVLTAEVYNPETGLKHRLVAETETDVLGN